MKLKNKKGLSEIVSYVLLILVALSLSVAVYTWLKVYVPKDKLECPDGVSLIIKELECGNANKFVNITFGNKGRFDVDGIYLKFSDSEKKVPYFGLPFVYETLCDRNLPQEQYRGTCISFMTSNSLRQNRNENSSVLYFGINGMKPEDADIIGLFDYSKDIYGNSKIRIVKVQVEPFVIDKKANKFSVCEDATISQEINCD